ncbi:helix-turn-helix domain-containing protein [Thermoproteota archaeon]
MATLMLYDWPGNVCELENTIEHAFVLFREDLIRLEHLPDRIHKFKATKQVPAGLTLREIEKYTIEQALLRNQYKKVATARELGIYKNTLRRKIICLGIKTASEG